MTSGIRKIGDLGRETGTKVETIRYAALVHDIGKIAQRPDVIRKPTVLSDQERTLMMRHPEATVTLKVDGPRGGTSLQIRRYSAVALAEAAAKMGREWPQ